jgi:hypothetical protein
LIQAASKYLAVDVQGINEAEKWFRDVPMIPLAMIPPELLPMIMNPQKPGGGNKKDTPGMKSGPNGNGATFAPPPAESRRSPTRSMKRIVRYLKDVFSMRDLHNLDVNEILLALNDASVRKTWIYELCEELKRLNLEVDKRLLSGSQYNLTDLAARRKAFQDVLELVLSARRRNRNPNPKSEVFDLDNVTVQIA